MPDRVSDKQTKNMYVPNRIAEYMSVGGGSPEVKNVSICNGHTATVTLTEH